MHSEFELLSRAKNRALLSRKKNTKVGALLVDEVHNVIVEARNDCIHPLYENINLAVEADRHLYSEHAERRLIFSAITLGIFDFQNKTLVVTHFPCCDCSRAIILIGIKKIITFQKMDEDYLQKWGKNINISKEMLEHNNIEIVLK